MFTDFPPLNHRKKTSHGFTLIELSIVLVIIGLIIGGVLSGQDLIAAAQQRALIKQKEQFDLASNTFRLKYSNLPGDYSASTVINGVTVTAGDGNGSITDTASATTIEKGTFEIFQFWQHLGAAGLVDGGYGVKPSVAAMASSALYGSGTFPKSKLGRNSSWVAYSNGGTLYYQLGEIAFDATLQMTGGATSLTAAEAKNVDDKMDDGLPTSGVVKSWSTAAAGGFGAATISLANATGCYNTVGTATNNVYNVSNNTASCQLRFKASF